MGEAGGPRGEGKSPPGSQEEGSEAGLLRGRWYLVLGAGLSAMSELLSVAMVCPPPVMLQGLRCLICHRSSWNLLSWHR